VPALAQILRPFVRLRAIEQNALWAQSHTALLSPTSSVPTVNGY
jgi:hypothetical protein